MCCLQLREPFAGKFVRSYTLSTLAASNLGFAVSPHDDRVVISHTDHMLSVYSLPEWECLSLFGGEGPGKGQFSVPVKLCFSAGGNVLVVERGNKRVQEVTLTGEHVRFIGVGVAALEDGDSDTVIRAVAANADLIAVGKWGTAKYSRIVLFDAHTGAFRRSFGELGQYQGQLMKYCEGLRFLPDGRHLLVAESMFGEGRLSLFTVAGEFVRYMGIGKLKAASDVDVFHQTGDIVVPDAAGHRVTVFSSDGKSVLKQWGDGTVAASDNGVLRSPTAVCVRGCQVLVLERDRNRIVVFE